MIISYIVFRNVWVTIREPICDHERTPAKAMGKNMIESTPSPHSDETTALTEKPLEDEDDDDDNFIRDIT